VKKGTQVFVEGKIQTRSWDDKESGQKRYKTEILVNELSLLGGGPGRQSGEGGGSSRSTNSSSASPSSPEYADQGITDEDIPF
jgi:single-strand DNA-binding protein